MTRSRKAIINGLVGLIKQLVIIVCGFILPRYMLLYYGSSLNGLVASITQFLGFISLLEMGIGPVIQASLYKPLSEKNDDQISRIIISAERFYRKIAYIFIGYIAILICVFPKMINDQYSFGYTGVLILIISISTIAQYLFGATYQALLNAAQVAFIQNALQIIAVLLNTAISVFLILKGAPIYVVQLVTAIVFLIRPIGQALYIKKNFSINRKLVITEEPIKQKWNGFAQHLAGWVCAGTDSVVLTLFSTLENISIYSVYYTVTISLTNIVITVATGIEALFGDMIAKGEFERLNKTFNVIEFVTHFIVTFVFAIATSLIVPFVAVYTKGITDANYIQPLFACLLVMAYAIQTLRVPYSRVVNAAGAFKQTQIGALISAAINIIVTIILVLKYGLIGTSVGTLIAMLYHTCYYVWYLSKNILKRSVWIFIKRICCDIIVIFGVYVLSQRFIMKECTYLYWLILAIKVAIVTGVVLFITNCLIHFKEIRNVVGYFIKKSGRKIDK